MRSEGQTVLPPPLIFLDLYNHDDVFEREMIYQPQLDLDERISNVGQKVFCTDKQSEQG